MHVLVVEDDRLNCLTMVHLLADAGHDAHGFESAEEAIKALAAVQFEIILLDLRLPNMNGITLLEKVRMARPKIRVIMMSAHWTEKTRETAQKLGTLAILSKPFPVDELLNILKRV